MEHLIFSLNATIPVFLTMVIGYLLKQCRLMDESFVKTLNKFNFQVTLPVMLFEDLAGSDFTVVWDGKYVLFCFVVTLISIVVIWCLSTLLLKEKDIVGEFTQGCYRSSAAVLGLAFIQNIYGTSQMAPLMIIGTVPLYNIMAVIILSFTGPGEHQLNKESLRKSVIGIAKNPIIISIVLGIAASLLHVDFPFIIDKTIHNFAVIASPLALVGLGAGFEGRKAIKKLCPTVICTAVKLFVLPALFLPLALYLGFKGEKMVAILVMLGSATTPSCYIMAKNMGHEGTLTSSTVVATTFFSSISLTFWLFVLKYMGVI
ncbi:MAG: AEC family transporter [Lachnospiraceae bacterium]|nr:AEC family transporter [Lachnospiraceae bacterium]